MVYCNDTAERLIIHEEALWDNGLSFHTLITYIAGGCTCAGVILSLFSIWMHATSYTKPYEQRHVLRIIFMVPVYSIVSFLSIVDYRHAIYFQLLSDTYSAIAVASGYALFIHYVAPNVHDQKQYFRNIRPRAWTWPVSWFGKCCGSSRGPWRTPMSGLTWYNIISTGVYQYCAIRFINSVIAISTQSVDLYCELSNNPVYAHIWVLIFDFISSSIALYCLGQFRVQMGADLEPHGTEFKFHCLNAVLSLSQAQNLIISLLTSSWLPAKIRNEVAPTAKLNAQDIKIGIPCLLLCFELAIIAILHLFAFSTKEYNPIPEDPTSNHISSNHGPRQGGFLGIKAVADALNLWDIAKGFARSIRWLLVGRRYRREDPSYSHPALDMGLSPYGGGGGGGEEEEEEGVYYKTNQLPIAQEFRRSGGGFDGGLLAQQSQLGMGGRLSPPSQVYDGNDSRQDVNWGRESLHRPEYREESYDEAVGYDAATYGRSRYS